MSSSGTGSDFSERIVISASCTSAGMRVSSSTRASAPRRIARMTGPRHQRRLGGALGQQPGVVPAVAQCFLAGAGGALHDEGRVAETAAARCSLNQVLPVPGTPSSRSARSVASVATAISSRRAGPMYLGTTTNPPGSVVPRQVADHRPRRAAPTGRTGPIVGLVEGGQLGGELLLGVGPQERVRRSSVRDLASPLSAASRSEVVVEPEAGAGERGQVAGQQGGARVAPAARGPRPGTSSDGRSSRHANATSSRPVAGDEAAFTEAARRPPSVSSSGGRSSSSASSAGSSATAGPASTRADRAVATARGTPGRETAGEAVDQPAGERPGRPLHEGPAGRLGAEPLQQGDGVLGRQAVARLDQRNQPLVDQHRPGLEHLGQAAGGGGRARWPGVDRAGRQGCRRRIGRAARRGGPR